MSEVYELRKWKKESRLSQKKDVGNKSKKSN